MRRAFACLGAALLLAGCAGRGLLPEHESREAHAFFSGPASRFEFPATSSFSGVAEKGGDTFPFVAGVEARGPADESVGLYDPLGHDVMMMSNDGSVVALKAGTVAGALAPLDGKKVPAGGLSLGRVLWGAPGYPVGKGEFRGSGDGGWQFSDGRQTLRSDPSRRFIAEAEYKVAGRSVTVTYPEREAGLPPALVRVEVFGAKVELRRDTE
jgi:hypothetical protein